MLHVCVGVASLLVCVSPGASAQTIEWESIGPDEIGGRVSALAVSPHDPHQIVVGTPAGGLWQSSDGGLTWSIMAPWLAALPISAMAIDPVNPAVMFAGTGEMRDGGSLVPGVGLLRTVDGGTDWTVQPGIPSGAYVSSVLALPGALSRVLVGTDLGIYLSIDGGGAFGATLVGQPISQIVSDPFDPQRLYAAGREGLFRSTDAGSSWTRIVEWPLLESDHAGVATAALTLSTQTNGLLYATAQVLNDAGETDRVLTFRSTDAGVTLEAETAPAFCAAADSCGFAHATAVDPNDDRRRLLAGDRLYVSRDGGATWEVLSPIRVHTIMLLPTGGVIAGATGVYALDATWSSVEPRNAGLSVTSIVSLDVSPDSSGRVLAATADTGTVLGAGDGSSWQTIFGLGEPAGEARFDPFDAARIFASKVGGRLYRSDDDGATFVASEQGLDLGEPAAAIAPLEPSPVARDEWFTARLQLFNSFDGGASWGGFRPAGFLPITRLAPSPVQPQRVYFALSEGADLYKADGLDTRIVTITNRPNVSLTAIWLDPAAENVLYVGAIDKTLQRGLVFKSYDFGESWADITPAAGVQPITSLVKDAFGALYVSTASGIWRSANDGFTWAPFSQGLLGVGVNVLRTGDGHLFAGTRGRGVYRTPEPRVTSVDSILPGQLFRVDDVLTTGPLFLDWVPDSTHTVEAVLTNTDDVREEFVSWSDGGSQAHVVSAGDGTGWLTAAVHRSYRLRGAVSPTSAGTMLFTPTSADGFYAQGTIVTAVAVPAPDQRFAGFGGDVVGRDDLLGVIPMDRTRSVSARFEPLVTEFQTSPAGLSVLVDGGTVTTPAQYRWPAGSQHEVSAPPVIDVNPADPVQLFFDGWTDFGRQTHTVTATRDAIGSTLTARYVASVPELDVPPGAARVLATPGAQDASRIASLHLDPAGQAAAPEALQIVTGDVRGETTTALAVVPATPSTAMHSFVEGGDKTRTRLILHNPNPVPNDVSLLLRNAFGTAIAAVGTAVSVPPYGQSVRFLDELIGMETYQGLLTLLSQGPLVASFQSIRQNVRELDFPDPILLVPFTAADRGVPSNPRTQALLVTPNTESRIVLSNPGTSAMTGRIRFYDEAGASLTVDRQGFATNSVAYYLLPGGHLAVRFRTSAAGTGAALVTAQARIAAGVGGVPLVQLVENRTFDSSVGPVVLPRTLPPSRSGKQFQVPVDPAARDSGLVLTNRSGTAVTVILTLTGGLTGQPVFISVPPRGQRAVLASAHFGASGPGQGILTAWAFRSVDAVGIFLVSNGRGEDIVGGFPALDPRASALGAAHVFPFAMDGDSWSTQLWLLNPSAAARRAVIGFRGESGETVHLPLE